MNDFRIYNVPIVTIIQFYIIIPPVVLMLAGFLAFNEESLGLFILL